MHIMPQKANKEQFKHTSVHKLLILHETLLIQVHVFPLVSFTLFLSGGILSLTFKISTIRISMSWLDESGSNQGYVQPTIHQEISKSFLIVLGKWLSYQRKTIDSYVSSTMGVSSDNGNLGLKGLEDGKEKIIKRMKGRGGGGLKVAHVLNKRPTKGHQISKPFQTVLKNVLSQTSEEQ